MPVPSSPRAGLVRLGFRYRLANGVPFTSMAINTSALRRIAGPLVDYFNVQFEALKTEMRTQSDLQAAHFDEVLEASNTRLFDVVVDRDIQRQNQIAQLQDQIAQLTVTIGSLTTDIADLQHATQQLVTITQELLAVNAASMTPTPE